MRRLRLPTARLLFPALAVLFAACEPNAVLELQVELPAAVDDGSGEPWFAITELRSGATDFSMGWLGQNVEAVELGAAPRWDCISVRPTSFTEVVPGGSEAAPLDVNVRVRFCHSRNCADPRLDGPRRERWYRLQRPFYEGRRTYWRTTIDEVPECSGDEECGGLGVCEGGVCGCDSTAQCPSGYTCEPGEFGGNCLLEVDRCSIEGCNDGETNNFCSLMTGQHFCEFQQQVERRSECDAR